MPKSSIPSPFHRGERDIQARKGVRDRIEDIGQRFIRDHLPDEHRQFYGQLPILPIGSVDKSGRPWASVLVGRPGFVQSPDPKTLAIAARPIFGDPLNEHIAPCAAIGILGIEYHTRRRNRLTGKLTGIDDDGIRLRVDQTFGNCPQYIQTREFEFKSDPASVVDPRPVRRLNRLDERASEIIAHADHFFIATHFSEGNGAASYGTDVSHRGGKNGFVRIDDDQTLTFPDFTGNYHFNTLGNILLNPRAGLLFIDFEKGDLLFLTCSAEIIWDSEERRAFDGAEQLVRFRIDEGFLVENGMPIQWKFLEYSPSLEQTGTWKEVAESIAARQEGNIYRNYKVVRVEPESEIITSFYLQPEDSDHIPCHKAGQFLPIEIKPPGSDEPIRKIYTISNAPNGSYYRLSIKREPPARPNLPPGVSSNYFHDVVKEGTTIRAMSPRGKFSLDESSIRPVVLLSGGVGITPLLSMMEQLFNDSQGCGCKRNVWFIHAARERKLQAFADYVRKLEREWPCLNVHIRYSHPSTDDVEGEHYDSTGHVDVDLLKSLLPFDDYEFYMCGPIPFMESLYQGLKDLNVAADERIHYEFFGAGSTLLKEQPGVSVGLAEELSDRPPVRVRFAKSKSEAVWEASKGTLLDLAEAEGLRPAYSCRSGICQTCATRVLSGEVDYLEPPMAAPPTGEALICCSYPQAVDADDPEIVLNL